MHRLTQLLADGYRVVVAADGEGSAERLAALLRDHGLDLPVHRDGAGDLTKPGGHVVVAPLHMGATLPAAKLAIVAESDLTGRRRAHRRPRARKRDTSGFFEDLKPGNYVVHVQHGVGKYEGMVKRTIGGVERDYLLVAYKGDDKLYVPSDQIDVLRQYVGGEAPTLHRLGGSDFAKAKSRVRSAVREIAQELVVLYQKRVNAEGYAFGQDTPWQHEMEDAFPYVETPDQRVAIVDVKADMERPYPMDRLVCGDVGFGKTEVAIRAAFKAIQDGKQVAVLAPTTLLATQHGNTFADRFAGYPIRVETLSRFLTPAQARDVVKGIESGDVDCVIGTHRLLGEQVRFKDLGLLVVDEEQRFGVTHKEAMKQLKTNVDVLTLTATPIPRTLEMSLVGIRDLSLLQTPPSDRQPILTYVGGYDERVAVEAIRRELLREGQVFWVHNRVRSIEHAAARLRELVPEARIAVAHGQMDEGTLEQVVVDFWDGQFDVLVCTTIIESGIDMPTVNTLVVERSDLLGLGQMHQLRGRVGRSGQRAYAYLFHPVDTVLTEEAYERLKTIGEATELGSGFKIAMRDLEIRGAGNLLGEAQSGHIAAVGYDLYCQMVTEAVAEMKGEPVRPPAEIKLDVPTDAFLPKDYVAKEELRLEAYRRLAAVTTDGPGRRHPHRVGGPLRPAAAGGRGAADRRLPARRVPPPRHHRHRDVVRPGPPGAARAEAEPDDPAAPAVPRRDLQGGRPPARPADPAHAGAGRLPRRAAARAGARRCRGWVGDEPPGSFGAVTNRLAAAGAAVLAVLAVSGCGAVPAAGTAATVGDQDISVDDFERLLRRRDGARGPVRHRRRPDDRDRRRRPRPAASSRCSCRARSPTSSSPPTASRSPMPTARPSSTRSARRTRWPTSRTTSPAHSSTRRPAHRPRPASRRRRPRSCRPQYEESRRISGSSACATCRSRRRQRRRPCSTSWRPGRRSRTSPGNAPRTSRQRRTGAPCRPPRTSTAHRSSGVAGTLRSRVRRGRAGVGPRVARRAGPDRASAGTSSRPGRGGRRRGPRRGRRAGRRAAAAGGVHGWPRRRTSTRGTGAGTR